LVAFFPDGTKIAIECDGDKWHGADKYQDDMLRQKVLERCGWQFFRIRGGEYYSNKEKALAPLWKIFEKYSVDSPIAKKVIPESYIEKKEKVKIYKELEWESKTCYWSSVKKLGYRYAPKKNAWYKKKSIDDFSLNLSATRQQKLFTNY